MPASPCSVTPRKRWGWATARSASMAICTPPSVPFLKPTGIDSAEASSRCTWLSVVRAPIAPQVTRSAMNCGVMGSRNSQPAGTPSAARSSSSRRARRSPSLIANEPSRRGSLIRPFQPTVVRGFSKYTRMTIRRSPASSSPSPFSRPAYSAAALGSWTEHGPTTTIRRSSVPVRIAATSSRAPKMSCEPSSLSGSSSSRMAGGRSGRIDSTRRSRVFIGGTFYPVARPVFSGQDHERGGQRARRREAREAPVDGAKPTVDGGQDGPDPFAMKDRRGDQIGRGVNPPRVDRSQAGGAQQRAKLARLEEANGAVAGIFRPHAAGPVAHDLPPRLRRCQSVAEEITGDAVDQRPREIETAAVLALEQQQAAGPEHTAELTQRPRGIVDEGQRAAAAHDGVEDTGRVGKRFDRPLHRRHLRQSPPGDGEHAGGDVEAVRLVAEPGEELRLEAGPASGIERAALASGERAAKDLVHAFVEVLIPRLEHVTGCRHGVEPPGDLERHRPFLRVWRGIV